MSCNMPCERILKGNGWYHDDMGFANYIHSNIHHGPNKCEFSFLQRRKENITNLAAG
jgi:hypothetical protein